MNFNTDTEVNETTFDDLKEYYEITDSRTITELIGDIVILNRYNTPSAYQWLYEHTVDVASLCWNNRDERGNKLQHTPIKFKVDIDSTVTYTLTLNKFMMSLVFLRPVMKFIEDINIEDYIISSGYLTEKQRMKIHNKTNELLMSYGYSTVEVQEQIARSSLDLKELLLVFAQADMTVFTAENLFLDHYMESEVIRNINNTEYPKGMQTQEIVEQNKQKYEILQQEMLNRGNPFFVCNKYTSIIKPKQMEELYINFSQIPDGRDIIPVIMNGNGFKAGYHDMPVLYAGAIAGRVPDIMNNDHMGEAGYFGRNLWILTYGTLSKTVYDCGSKNPIPVEIDETELEMKEGRFYYEYKNSGVLKVLKKSDKHLIGKTLWFRSPCTCNLNEDCCHVCYGTIALKVGELPGGFIYTTELMASRISQNILSAKHLLKTNAEKIEFSDGYDEYFIIENSTLVPKDEKRFDIYLKEDYLDNISEELVIYVTKSMIPIKITKYANISIPQEVVDEFKEVIIDDEAYYKLTSFKVLEHGGILCDIIPINISMTAKYFNLKRLFENEISKFDKLEDAVKELTHLLYKTIPILSVHGEIILSHLTRRPDNKILRPNWLNEDEPYQMLALKQALSNSESITTALSFEQTKHHLLHSIFDERNKINRVGPRSFGDYLFGEETL